MNTFPTKAGKRLAHFAAVPALAALVFLAAGCASGVAIRITPGFGDEPRGPEPPADKAPPAAAPEPAPRTLPQAVCAYLKCLRACPCNQDADAKKNGEQEGKKNPEKKNGDE